MIPESLAEWGLNVIQTLCAAGQSESDRHDFKFGLPDSSGLTKLCCAFANTFGGFIVVGVKDVGAKKFEIVGIEPDKELYGIFLSKVKADPDITVLLPKLIDVPDTQKVLYVFEIPRSPRRPHLPSATNHRVFWKRQGSYCEQMTLEEVRSQMISYEEKREKLALLLMDAFLKLQSLRDQADKPDGYYDGVVYSFDVFDRVVVESYAIMKKEVSDIARLDSIRRKLSVVNLEKQRLISMLSLSYSIEDKNRMIADFREVARRVLPGVTELTKQIENSFLENYGISNPCKL